MKITQKLLLVIALCQSLPAQSAIETVRAQSMGGAFRAVSSNNDAIVYNPAGLLNQPVISAQAEYLALRSNKSHRVNASLVDSQTTSWGMGVFYGSNFGEPITTVHNLHLALAVPIIPTYLTLGGAGTYAHDPHLGFGDVKNFFNLDVGLAVGTHIGLSFAAVADHLAKPKGLEKPMGLAFATAYNLGQVKPEIPLIFAIDWLMDDVASDFDLDHQLGLGLEYLVVSLFPVRLGFNTRVKAREHKISLGTGMISGPFLLEGLYQQDLKVGSNRQFGLSLVLNF
jgi:hypothetical protein